MPSKPLDPRDYRPDFPILARMLREGVPLVYLDNAATTQRPRQVIQAMVDAYEQHYGNVHRGVHVLAEESTALYEAAREKVAKFIGSPTSEQVIFTHGATEAINLVARTWGDRHIGRGDCIVVTEMEHHANLVPWHQLAERTGAIVRAVPVTDDGRLDLESLDRLLAESPKLVAVTAVSNVLGTINPIDEIIRRGHQAGAVVLVDGAQSVPHEVTNVAAWDADFLAFSGHKMLGPTGVGVLYGKREILESMPPFLGGGHMIHEVRLDGYQPSRAFPDRFEAGTPPIVPAIGLAAAIDYLERIGLEAIRRHEARLICRVHDALSSVEGLRLLGPGPEHKAGIASFVLDRIHAHDVAQRLDTAGIAVRPGHHCAMPLHACYGVAASTRASFYFYNTLDEVDALANAINAVRTFFRRRK
jgi:cysteine desulfurase/selenocysteine lyase